MLLGIPEYKVALPGGGRASQNDLFVLARTDNEIFPIIGGFKYEKNTRNNKHGVIIEGI